MQVSNLQSLDAPWASRPGIRPPAPGWVIPQSVVLALLWVGLWCLAALWLWSQLGAVPSKARYFAELWSADGLLGLTLPQTVMVLNGLLVATA